MRNTITIALVATLFGLAGCSTFDEKPVPLMNVNAGTVTAIPAIAAPAPAPTIIATDKPIRLRLGETTPRDIVRLRARILHTQRSVANALAAS